MQDRARDDETPYPGDRNRQPDHGLSTTLPTSSSFAGAAAGDRDRVTSQEDLGDNRDGLGRDRTDAIETEETHKLISADKVVGTAVYNAAGDRIGTIDSIMINKYSGKVAFAVMSFGGFLGIGERYHPLPWSALTYDEEKGGYNIDISTEQLQGAPNYTREELERADYATRGETLRNYYGVTAW